MILGLETSTYSGGAALLQVPGLSVDRETPAATMPSANLIGSICFSTRELYSQRLLPSVEWLLDRTTVTMQDISVIGVSVGPGSFTGLRIGLSVAKALAYVSGAKLVGVSTLEALAVRASGGRNGLVCPMLDARQGQVYAGLYDIAWENGFPATRVVREDWAGPVEDVADWIDKPTIFAGDALALAAEKIGTTVGKNFVPALPHQALPHPEDVAMLTAARALAGQYDDPVALEPRYVRQSYTQRGPSRN